jgi:hypothetical protein
MSLRFAAVLVRHARWQMSLHELNVSVEVCCRTVWPYYRSFSNICTERQSHNGQWQCCLSTPGQPVKTTMTQGRRSVSIRQLELPMEFSTLPDASIKTNTADM